MKKLLVCLFVLTIFSLFTIGQNTPNDLLVFGYSFGGEADDAFAWAQPGGKCAVKFHPWLSWYSYPLRVVGGAVWLHPDWPSGQIIGSSFRIEVYDDDGVDGYPNTLLGSVDCVVDSTEWFEFYGLDITIDEGMFYIAMVQTDMAPDCAALGIDYQSTPYAEMSYWQVPVIAEWEFSWHQNFMIRAFVDTEVGLKDIYNESVLLKTYPNPFTTSTTIEYELKRISDIQFTVYNLQGVVIYETEERSVQSGTHKVSWSPSHLPAGMYYAVLRSEEGVSVVKMLKE